MMEFRRDADEDLTDDIAFRDLLHPIVLFKDHEGALWLISGDRRLRAWKATHTPAVPIPAVIFDAYDELFDYLLKEEGQQVDSFSKPMLPSEQLQFGLILRGVMIRMRSTARDYKGFTPGCSYSYERVAELFGVIESQWASLRILSCAYIAYEARRDTEHNPAYAGSVLERVDSGELTWFQAKTYYEKRPRNSTKRLVSPISSAHWEAQAPKFLGAVSASSEMLFDFRAIPNGVPADTLRAMLVDLYRVREQLNVLVRGIRVELKEKDNR